VDADRLHIKPLQTAQEAHGPHPTIGNEHALRHDGDTIGVLLAAIVLLIAVALGFALGGRLSALGRLHLRHSWLVVLALGAQLGGAALGGTAYRCGLAGSALLLGAFLVRNRGVHGLGLVALGVLCNAVVVGANGAMPVSADASGRAGISTQSLLRGSDRRHELAGDGTRLAWLGDVVPVLVPARPHVASPGDLLVLAGLAELLVVGMTRRRTVAG
jgi:hypothetical protein